MQNVVWALLPAAIFAVYSFGMSALMVLLLQRCRLCPHRTFSVQVVQKGKHHIRLVGSRHNGFVAGAYPSAQFPIMDGVFGGVIAIALGKFILAGWVQCVQPRSGGAGSVAGCLSGGITTWYPAFLDGPLCIGFLFHLCCSVYGATSTPLPAPRPCRLSSSTMSLPCVRPGAGAHHRFYRGDLRPADPAGGIYLIARNMMNWRIPVAILAGVCFERDFAPDRQAYPPPLFMLFSGD